MQRTNDTRGEIVVLSINSAPNATSEEDFDVDRKHLMENIRDQYTIALEEAVIVENVDNCIDENYHTICFNTTTDSLEILMLGDGMTEEVFWKTLAKIAATTKFEERSGKALGRYGWGMKISMYVSDFVIVETKRDDFHGAQRWRLVDGIPKRMRLEPSKAFSENFSSVQIILKNEFNHMSIPSFLEQTMQKYYPTILHGAKVTDRNGKKRELKVFINSKFVSPAREVEYEKKRPLAAKVDGESVSGYVLLSKEKLPEDDQGIKIIINGRKIMKDFFGVYGDKNDRVTGYLNADVLVEDIAGDKTSIRRISSHWRQLNEKIGTQLTEFMKEINAIREEKLPEKMFKQIQAEINNILKSFPELQELAKKAGISISGDILVPSQKGDVSTQLAQGSKGEHGEEAGSGGGAGIPVSPGEQLTKAPSDQSGDDKATKERKKRRGLNILSRPEAKVRSEAWFSLSEGIVIVNSLFPTYKKAERMGSMSYHMLRCGIEALLNYAAENGYINKTKLEDYRYEVFAKWGEL